MNYKRFALILLFLVIVVAFTSEMTGAKESPSARKVKQTNRVTFVVEVPQNTPKEDRVCIYVNNQTVHVMKKIAPFKYVIAFDRNTIGLGNIHEPVRYRYTRNCYEFRAAEYLEPDDENYFWTELGRRMFFQRGKIQRDVVKRWRWFPDPNTPLKKTSSMEPSGTFAPRMNNTLFQSGQSIEDFYHVSMDLGFDSTAKHLKKNGFTWVTILPPWQWISTDPLPIVGNSRELKIKEDPNYPNDAKLIEHIQSFKKAGLKVMLAPQICCGDINTENRSEEWWKKFHSEVERFMLHHAKIAAQTKSDAFVIDRVQPLFNSSLSDKEKRIRDMYKAIRGEFHGPIGEIFWASVDVKNREPNPPLEDITWGDELDFAYFIVDAPLTHSKNPTDAQLRAGAERILDGAKLIADAFDIPIHVRTMYFNIKETWRGSAFYQIDSVPWYTSSEKQIHETPYKFDTNDLSRTLNAFFEASRDRPWIIGLEQFSYTHMQYPLATDLSIRGKPAEDMWRKWNQVIFQKDIEK